jgi:DNA polymerase elongation subunit (family B)
MNMRKNDVSPKDIFELQKGDDKDRKMIAEYCLQDCALCNHLMMKLEILANNMGMSNVCLVPLSYIFMRGQGIKIFSLVLKQCKDEGFVIPVKKPASSFGAFAKKPVKNDDDEENQDEDSYEGAIVLEPKTGIYINQPITVFDYASLYPSSMISENLSHDMIILEEHKGKYDNLPGVEYLNISYDLYEGVGDKKKKVGERVCRFAQNEKGIIPRILQKLLTARKSTRKKIEWKQVTCLDGNVYRGLVVDDKEEDAVTIRQSDGDVRIERGNVSSIEDCFNEFQKAVLDGLQLAYKITANSLYGQIGAKTSPIYLKDIAACTTATGRKMILMAKDYMEKNYEGTEIIYGDSVTGDTPLIIRYPDGHIDIQTIETITSKWIAYDNFRPWVSDLHQKEQSFIDAEVWANGSWAKIHRVIRHKTNKKLYRVNTFEGSVDVTEDHSLLDTSCNKIKPGECVVGETELLHSFPADFKHVNIPVASSGKPFVTHTGVSKTCTTCQNTKDECEFYISYKKKNGDVRRDNVCKLCIKERNCKRTNKEFNAKVNDKVLQWHVPEYNITKYEAWVWGIFFGDGSCGSYESKNIKRNIWAINNSSLKYLDIARKYLLNIEPNNVVSDFIMLDTLDSSGAYKLVPQGSLKYMAEKYRALFYDKDDYKKIPAIILNASHDIRLWFMRGYLAADGAKGDGGIIGGRWNFACLGKIGAQGLFYLMKSLGWNDIRVNIQNYRDNTYWISDLRDKKYINSMQNKILKIHELPSVDTGTFVYDIETSASIFHAGVGSINIANTDSIFVRFQSIKPGEEKPDLNYCKTIGLEAQRNFKKLLKAPHDLELEKFFDPFILLSKKRYVGNMYELDVSKYKQKSMGIVLKRRDNAHIVKKIYGGAIDIILNKKDVKASVDFVRKELDMLIKGETSMDDLIITKSLRADYADPTKIAHKVLAERIGDRDPGNRPQVNDRIPYVYVQQPAPDPSLPKSKQPKILQGERIENPAYIREHNLKPDYGFYITNQIMKPLLQLYGIVADELGIRTRQQYEDVYNELVSSMDNAAKAKDKYDQLRENDIKEFLFDPFLKQISPELFQKRKRATKNQAAATTLSHMQSTSENIFDNVEPYTNPNDSILTQDLVEDISRKASKKPGRRVVHKPTTTDVDIVAAAPAVAAPKRRIVRKSANATT